ncbi:hypothetical protein K6106_14455 [Pseudomonas fluorescens]|nr:hypothetical protein K6106_14455 [Pseudomonas fluorescens]
MDPLPVVDNRIPQSKPNCHYWSLHPNMPDFDEGDGDKCKTWIAEQGLAVTMVSLEYADEAVADRYFESGDPHYSYWEPDRPDGEGWFCLAIHDTDDGPVCWWARNKATL